MQLGKFLFVGKSKRKVKDPAWVRDKSQSLCLMLCEETQCVVGLQVPVALAVCLTNYHASLSHHSHRAFP